MARALQLGAMQHVGHSRFRKETGRLLAYADVEIGGRRAWDIQVHNEELYARIIAKGSLGLGAAYMDGWWDCKRLDMFFERVLRAELDKRVVTAHDLWNHAKARVVNLQSPARAFTVGKRHYDIGNDLYRRMLDKRMIYSCGYWKSATSLEEAQEAKLDLVCRKLRMEPGMRVLDIGCGWGGAASYCAQRYGVEVVGVTISAEQAGLAREACRGLPVDIRLQDYRALDERFDRIFSIGMFEHVGSKNYRTFFKVARQCLAVDGLLLLHTIGCNHSNNTADPWINRYIFPNSMLPSAKHIAAGAEGLFAIEDWHNFGAYYDPTLMQWFRNFDSSWDALRHAYDERFRRMWTYYLLSCAGCFRARRNHVWQVVMSPKGEPGGYPSIR